jgi:hypothetical protein
MVLDGTYIHNNLMKLVGYKYIFCGTLPSDPPNFIKLLSMESEII